MTVLYNNAYNYTEAFRREVTCHELGHATAHCLRRAARATAAWNPVPAPYVDNANAHDYNIIEDVYNH